MPARFDNFNRSDGAIGTPSDGGSAWDLDGTWVVSSNRAACTTSSGLRFALLNTTDITNQVVQATVSVVGTNQSLFARSSNLSNFLQFQWASVLGYRLLKRVAGTYTVLRGPTAGTPSPGDVWRLECNGNEITAYINGSPVWAAVTESAHNTVTIGGIAVDSDTVARFDDFSITEFSSGDTTAPTLTSPTGAGGLGVCSGTVSTDEANGTLYAVATASATAPSAAQVKDGQDHTGSAALRVVSQSVSATGTQTVASGAISGGAGTRYLHYMHEDAATNQSAVVSSASFEVTAAATTLAVSVPDAAGVTGVNGVVLSAAAPGAGVSVIATVAGASFNGSGALSIDITGLGVTVGARRYVVLTKSDGTTGQSPAPFCAQGPVVAS